MGSAHRLSSYWCCTLYGPGVAGGVAWSAVSVELVTAVLHHVRTADLGGDASTTDFTDEVIRRVRTKVDVWSALADVER